MGWVNEVYREEEIFSNGCCIGKWLIILINIILFIVNFIICFDPIVNGSLYYYAQMPIQLYGAGSLLLAVLYIPSIIRGKKGSLLKVIANSIVAAALISWFPLFVYSTISQFIFRVIMPIGVMVLVSWFYRHMNRRNEQATVLMGRILGYRKFLQHVEKSRIEILMKDHPDLFFTVFSYTYVLNVSWEWLLYLEDIVFPVREKNELY